LSNLHAAMRRRLNRPLTHKKTRERGAFFLHSQQQRNEQSAAASIADETDHTRSSLDWLHRVEVTIVMAMTVGKWLMAEAVTVMAVVERLIVEAVMAMAIAKRFITEVIADAGSKQWIVALVLIRLSGHQLPLTQFLGFEEALVLLVPGHLLLPQLLVVAVFLQQAIQIAPRFRDILIRRCGDGFYCAYHSRGAWRVLINNDLPCILAFVYIGQPR
jgi:hypothetical protein